jgi:hypothetical protein
MYGGYINTYYLPIHPVDINLTGCVMGYSGNVEGETSRYRSALLGNGVSDTDAQEIEEPGIDGEIYEYDSGGANVLSVGRGLELKFYVLDLRGNYLSCQSSEDVHGCVVV